MKNRHFSAWLPALYRPLARW